MRVLFWGTPEFATAPLRALIGEGFDVVGVVTQPDKPVGRSRSTVQASPVKLVAVAEGIPVLQPEKPRGAEFMAEMAALAPDISVVVAYGHILPAAPVDQRQRDVLQRIEAGQQVKALEDKAQPSIAQPGSLRGTQAADVAPFQLIGAAGGRVQAAEQVEQR